MAQDAPPTPQATKPRRGFEFSDALGGDLVMDSRVIGDDDGRQYLHTTLLICTDPQAAQAEHGRLDKAGRNRVVAPTIGEGEIAVEVDASQLRTILMLDSTGLDLLIDHLMYARAGWTA